MEAGADVNAKDQEGRTALMYASKGEVAKILIEAGAELNAKDQKGETALLRASRGSCTGVVKVLQHFA
jgi:ankyrin repeat protein